MWSTPGIVIWIASFDAVWIPTAAMKDIVMSANRFNLHSG